MFNYRVENLEKLLEVLKEEGVEIIGEMEEYEYGKFGAGYLHRLLTKQEDKTAQQRTNY